MLVTSCVPQGGGILLWPHTRVEPAVGRQCYREASRAVQRPCSRANEASDFELPQATMSVLPDRVTPGNEESDSVCDVWLPTALTPHPRCSPLLASEQAGKKSGVSSRGISREFKPRKFLSTYGNLVQVPTRNHREIVSQPPFLLLAALRGNHPAHLARLVMRVTRPPRHPWCACGVLRLDIGTEFRVAGRPIFVGVTQPS